MADPLTLASSTRLSSRFSRCHGLSPGDPLTGRDRAPCPGNRRDTWKNDRAQGHTGETLYRVSPLVGVVSGCCTPPDFGITVSFMLVSGILGLYSPTV